MGLEFQSLADFRPERVAQRVVRLADFLHSRCHLSKLRRLTVESGDYMSALQALDAEIEALNPASLEASAWRRLRESARSLSGAVDAESQIEERIAELDARLNPMLRAILHADPFQRLEALWLGLHRLVRNSELGSMLRIQILDIGEDEIRQDLRIGPESSVLYDRIVRRPFERGTPFTVLAGHYEFGCGPEDISLLTDIARISAAGHAPFFAAASPEMFGCSAFDEIGRKAVLDLNASEPWRSFRAMEVSSHLALVLPRMMLRLPYGPDSELEEFPFIENPGGDNRGYLWGNAALAVVERLMAVWSLLGGGPVGGISDGGLIENLPIHFFSGPAGERRSRGPTDLDSRSAVRLFEYMSQSGFIFLAPVPDGLIPDTQMISGHAFFTKCPPVIRTRPVRRFPIFSPSLFSRSTSNASWRSRGISFVPGKRARRT